MKTDDKLALDLFHIDKEPHIQVDHEKCRACPHKLCTYVCPAQNYTLNGENDIAFSWEGCLECGTCRIVCDREAITWEYPRGGYGISYKY